VGCRSGRSRGRTVGAAVQPASGPRAHPESEGWCPAKTQWIPGVASCGKKKKNPLPQVWLGAQKRVFGTKFPWPKRSTEVTESRPPPGFVGCRADSGTRNPTKPVSWLYHSKNCTRETVLARQTMTPRTGRNEALTILAIGVPAETATVNLCPVRAIHPVRSKGEETKASSRRTAVNPQPRAGRRGNWASISSSSSPSHPPTFFRLGGVPRPQSSCRAGTSSLSPAW